MSEELTRLTAVYENMKPKDAAKILADLDLWGDASRVTHVWKGGELVKSPA